MGYKDKWKFIGRSDDGRSSLFFDSKGEVHYLRTTLGKFENYGIELARGKRFCTPLYDDYYLHNQPLTAEEKAYRKGFRACFAELERMKRGKKK